MTMDFMESLRVGDTQYGIDVFPLNAYLDSLSPRPRLPNWPGCSNGYYADWEIRDCPEGRVLCLAAISPRGGKLLAHLFPPDRIPGPATWFTGVVRGVRGEWRHTGYTARKIWDDEIVLEIVAGKVTREWVLDLRAVPDQTSEELRQSIPAFLLKKVED
jgi:hypothetical protein